MPDKFQILPHKRDPARFYNLCGANYKSQTNYNLQFLRLQTNKFWSSGIWSLGIVWNLVFGYWDLTYLYAQESKEPIIVNGDTVEYSTDAKEVTATGNVSVIYKGTKLTCHKLTVNTQTKDGVAEGDARVEDNKGVIEGSKISYNFQTKSGIIMDSEFRANPYFGKSESVNKVSDDEFIAIRGYMTTCSLDDPHYRIKSRKIDMFPNDKVKTRDDTVYVSKFPLFYLPQYNHSLKEPLMHVQFQPGKSKDWGQYLLSAWRYNITDNVSGRIYFDFRERLGVAEGFGLNYKSDWIGRGDFKYYYTQERSRRFLEGVPAEFQRAFIRWRHKWDMDERTNLISEYYKIVDSKRMLHGSQYNVLKDYFFREYEKDNLPLSYTLLHHNFNYSSMDFIIQKRTNRWYTQLEKLPEIKYSLAGNQIADTIFNFENNTQAANFNNKNAVPSSSTNDINLKRFDTTNKVSIPLKVAFINLSPFAMNRETFYDTDIYGSSISPRTVFYTGADASTKFYRIFNAKSNFLKLDINGLRHIITPSIGYSYNHRPTIQSSKLKQIDGVDSIQRNNSASLGLSNKVQTKRNNQTVDFLDLNLTNAYSFVDPDTHARRGSRLSDFLFDLKLLPYSWLRVDADATYKHSGPRSDPRYNHFSNVNYDITFNLDEERSFSYGQRYLLKGGNELTYSLEWRLTPKWKFSVFERYNRGHDPTLKRGLREQEYTLSRDLHCWNWEAVYNIKRGVGESIWFVFRLKAFPELEFEYNQSYHAPKPGSQSNP